MLALRWRLSFSDQRNASSISWSSTASRRSSCRLSRAPTHERDVGEDGLLVRRRRVGDERDGADGPDRVESSVRPVKTRIVSCFSYSVRVFHDGCRWRPALSPAARSYRSGRSQTSASFCNGERGLQLMTLTRLTSLIGAPSAGLWGGRRHDTRLLAKKNGPVAGMRPTHRSGPSRCAPQDGVPPIFGVSGPRLRRQQGTGTATPRPLKPRPQLLPCHAGEPGTTLSLPTDASGSRYTGLAVGIDPKPRLDPRSSG